MITVRRATVLGAGSWGTAFAKVLADAGTDVTLWARRPEQAERIERTRRNVEYHPDLVLPSSVHAISDADAAIADADLIVLAIPSQTLRGNLAQWSANIGVDATLVSLIKGIELGTGKRMTEVISEAAGVDPSRVAAVTGSNLAVEIAAGESAAEVVVSREEKRARAV